MMPSPLEWDIERYDGSISQRIHTPGVIQKKKSLAARLEFEMNEEKVSVNPRLLFQRLSVATSTKTDGAGQESFTYKLC